MIFEAGETFRKAAEESEEEIVVRMEFKWIFLI